MVSYFPIKRITFRQLKATYIYKDIYSMKNSVLFYYFFERSRFKIFGSSIDRNVIYYTVHNLVLRGA